MKKKDNPNLKANIAILCTYKFFFYSFLSTYKHLSKIANVEFVLDFTAKPRGSMYPEKYKDSFRRILMESGVYFRDIEACDLLPGEFFDKYSILVGSNMVGYLNHACNKNKRKVRVMYGLAKDGWAYGLYNAYFDLILCAGPYAHKRLSTLYSASIVSVGEPKLDSLYEEGFISKKAEEIFATLSKDKKVLLYMPTFGVLSSTKVTLPALVDLLQDYTIVIKLHHMTKLFSPEEMKYFEDPRFVVIDESVPVTDVLKLSDIVISDNSGSIFDALVAKKGLVLIDSIKNKESFFTESPFFLYQSNNDVAGTVTSEESLEQIIKKEGVAPVVGVGYKKYLEAGDLRLAIESAKNENYVSLQQKLVSSLYSHLDGDAGLRSANEIASLVGKTVSRDKTLERYVEEFSKRIILENSYSNEEAAKNRADILSLIKSIRILPIAKKLDILYKIFIENKK